MLSNGAINNLLRISSTNVLDTIVDYNLHLISLNLQSKQNNIKRDFDLYTCTLADTKFSYSGFILSVSKEKLIKLNPKIGDIIKVSKISTSKLTYNGCKIIIIKKYEILKSSVQINTNLIQVESYQDIQNKISEENKKQQKLEQNNLLNTNNNSNINTNINTNTNLINNINKDPSETNEQEKKKIKFEYKIINPEDIDTKLILDLSQISTFTKNISLYVKLTKKRFPRKFYNKVTNRESFILSFDLIDKNGFQMQAAIYDDTIEKFSPILKEGNIYYIKGGYAKLNDKRYSNIKTDYRLIFDFNTQIYEVDKNLDKIFEKTDENLNITKFVDLNNIKQNQLINCLGYILQTFPPLVKNSRNGNVLMKKIFLCDSSMFKVQLTMWNNFTELNINPGDILYLKNIRVGNYNNIISLSTVDNSEIEINPDLSNENCKEYDDLIKVINEGINEEDIKNINDYNITNYSMNNDNNTNINRSLANNKIIFIKDLVKQLYNKYNSSINNSNNNNYNNFNYNEISMNFTIKATVLEFEHSDKNYYFACPNCRKKLVQKDDKFSCPGCESQINDAMLNYFLTLRVIDISGEHALNLFGDQVNNLFGMDAKSYSNLIENKEYKKLEKITNNVEYHCFYFNGKANIVKYGNRVKTQFSVYHFEREDFKKEQKRIFGDINDVLNINE